MAVGILPSCAACSKSQAIRKRWDRLVKSQHGFTLLVFFIIIIIFFSYSHEVILCLHKGISV